MHEGDWIAAEDWRCLREDDFFEPDQPDVSVADTASVSDPGSAGVFDYTFKYEKLHVYRMARALRKQFYKFAKTFPIEERFALASQLRRSSMSVVLNLVEGSLRRTGKEQARFTEIAHGSLHEAFACILEAEDEKYVKIGTQLSLRKEVYLLGCSLHKLLEFQLAQSPKR